MENNEELIQQLNWVKYRLRMLDLIEEKLLKMKALACLVKDKEMDKEEIENINLEIQRLAKEVNGLDEESRVI